MNIQNNSNTQQLKDAYMVLSLKKIGQEKESSPIDFNTFSKLMKDDSVINPTLSREAPENFTTNDGVKSQDLKWSIEIDKIISKAFEKGLVNKNNL